MRTFRKKGRKKFLDILQNLGSISVSCHWYSHIIVSRNLYSKYINIIISYVPRVFTGELENVILRFQLDFEMNILGN